MKVLLARLCDIVLIVAGAIASTRIGPAHAGLPLLKGLYIATIVALAFVMLPAFSTYRSWRGRRTEHLVFRLIAAWLVTQASGVVLISLLATSRVIPWEWLTAWTLCTAALLALSRFWAYAALRRFRHAGLDARRIAIVGGGAHFHSVIRSVDANGMAGFRIEDVIELRALTPNAHIGHCADDDRELAHLIPLIERRGIQEVWLALPLSADGAVRRCMHALRHTLVNVRLCPDVGSLGLDARIAPDIVGIPSISISASALSRDAMTSKEVFDRLFAAVALLGLLPLFVCIAIAVKLSSPGPVLFKQRRKGLNGRAFTIFKFRSMRLHAQKAGVLEQARTNDVRVTGVGRFLRKTSLDELPQFINVLRGEMSVVGPRPHALEHDALYMPLIAGYIDRYRIKPGITGWAQINGHRGETDRIEKMAARVEYDLYYLRHWSFGFDIRIVISTIAKGFIGAQAY